MGKQSKKKGNFLTSAHQALQRKGVVKIGRASCRERV